MRENFDSLKMPSSIVDAFPPDKSSLFDRIRALATDDILKWIAGLDYGENVSEHLKKLKALRSGEDLGKPMEWEPGEVVALCRWDDPNRKERGALSVRERHIGRVFCSICLLLIEDAYENRTLNEPDTVAALVDSVLALDVELEIELARFLVHVLQRMEPWDEEFLFDAFCLLLLLAESKIADRETMIDFSGWLAEANRQIVPWHEGRRTKRNVKVFTQIEFATIHEAKWKHFAERIRMSAPFQVDLFELIEWISPTKR